MGSIRESAVCYSRSELSADAHKRVKSPAAAAASQSSSLFFTNKQAEVLGHLLGRGLPTLFRQGFHVFNNCMGRGDTQKQRQKERR